MNCQCPYHVAHGLCYHGMWQSRVFEEIWHILEPFAKGRVHKLTCIEACPRSCDARPLANSLLTIMSFSWHGHICLWGGRIVVGVVCGGRVGTGSGARGILPTGGAHCHLLTREEITIIQKILPCPSHLLHPSQCIALIRHQFWDWHQIKDNWIFVCTCFFAKWYIHCCSQTCIVRLLENVTYIYCKHVPLLELQRGNVINTPLLVIFDLWV